MGASVDYLVPDRFVYGYGLTPAIVDLAAQKGAQLILTVDNGMASIDGVAEAKKMGIDVIITDHHLPAETLPAAACIVNPNTPGCDFPSKNLAGVGVMYYVLMALRAEFRRRGKLRYVPEQRLPGYGGMCKNHLLRLPRPGKPLNHTGPFPSCHRREPVHPRFSCPVLDRSDFFRNLLNFFAFWHYNPNDRMEKC